MFVRRYKWLKYTFECPNCLFLKYQFLLSSLTEEATDMSAIYYGFYHLNIKINYNTIRLNYEES